jgi:hypothetical protein
MSKDEIEAELGSEPFVPLRLHLSDGRKIEVPFKHVIVFLRYGIIVFKGVKKAGSHVAKGYEVIAYDKVK